MTPSPARPVEALLVTGPLGSGKTTLVNRLLRAELEAGHRVSVLINEFGSVSVDGALIEGARPELAGIESLVNGCACCSLRPEVVTTLAGWCRAEGKARPNRIVIETTGLADPTDLVDLESEPELAGHFRLAGCLTVVSCLTPLHHLRQRLLLRHQVALASLVHVSKADLDPAMAVAWEGEVRSLHPAKPIARTRHGLPPEGAPDPWIATLPPPEPGGAPLSFGEARALTLSYDHPVDPAALEALFQRPLPGGELLRAKGVVSFAGWPARHDGSDRWAFQLADGRLEVSPLPAGPSGTLASRVAVVIGLDLDARAWRRALRDLERPPEGARRRVAR